MDIIKPVDESQVRIDLLPDFDPSGRVVVSMLRLDRIHPLISGNKWYKLSLNLEAAFAQGFRHIVTFGGAYSNHLIAAAAAAQANGLRITGVVRGEEFSEALNPVLRACADMGMELHFVSRSEYKLKENNPVIRVAYPDAYFIPEGGANDAGRMGIAAISALIPSCYTHVAVSVGSGTTFEGLRNAMPASQYLAGFAPIKGGTYLKQEIRTHLHGPDVSNWSVTDEWAFGGFGKCTPELIAWMQSFRSRYDIELDRVYTGKMMYGIQVQLAAGHFPAGAHLLCIHTGGLTGNGANI